MTWIDVSVGIRDGMVHLPDNPPIVVDHMMDMAPPGLCDRIGVPIKLAGGDGAPARAFVRPHDGEPSWTITS